MVEPGFKHGQPQLTCDTAPLYQNSVSISPTTDVCVIRNVFFPVSGDVFLAVMYTVEHSIGQLKSSEHPNEAKSKPFGANIYMVVQMLPNSKNSTLLKLTWLAGSTFMC